MQVGIVDDERNGAYSGEAAHDKQGAGGTARLAAGGDMIGSGRCQ